MIYRIILFAFITFSKGSIAQKTVVNTPGNMLYNCWTDSREEDDTTTSYNIYRLCDYKNFSSARFRTRIEFKENGECSSIQLAPVQQHYMAPDKWDYDREQKII